MGKLGGNGESSDVRGEAPFDRLRANGERLYRLRANGEKLGKLGANRDGIDTVRANEDGFDTVRANWVKRGSTTQINLDHALVGLDLV